MFVSLMSNGQLTLQLQVTAQNSWLGAMDPTHPMAQLLADFDLALHEPRMGEVRTGIVVDKRPHELLIDIGFKSEGVVNGRELERVSEEFAALKVGDEIPVYVLRETKTAISC